MFDPNNGDGQGADSESVVDYSSNDSVDYRVRLRSSMGSVIIQDVPDTAMRFDVPVFSRTNESNPVEQRGASSLNREPAGRGSGKIAGFIYIGHKTEEPSERRRPNYNDVVSYI